MVKKVMLGWDVDEDRKKCVALMREMARDGLFTGYPRLLSVWEILIRHYDGGIEDQLKNIGNLIDSKDAPSNRNKSGSEAKREIAEILDLYFNICSKGKEAEYVLSFAPKSPRLKLEKRDRPDSTKPLDDKSNEGAAEKDTDPQEVIYLEKIYWERRYSHLKYFLVVLAVAPIIFILFMLSLYGLSLAENRSSVSIVLSLAAALEVPLCLVYRALIKLSENNFTHLILKNIFLKRSTKNSEEYISMTSYSGKCPAPECPGQLYLSSEFIKGLGYVGKCYYPDYHRFTFDPVTLRGRRINKEI